MSIRLEMLQVARLAPKLLGESTGLITDFFRRQQNADGGFRDRAGGSDLYYTVFGLEGLRALEIHNSAATVGTLSGVETYLRTFGGGAGLDFVHLCCLARCWAALPADRLATESRQEMVRSVGRHRTPDGGYHPVAGQRNGTAYGCFLAVAAHQDLQWPVPDPAGLAQCLKSVETPDGAWANERGLKLGSTNATAATVTLLRNLPAPVLPTAGDWLLARVHAGGGFLAAPGAPIPDLLSTATSLHALAGLSRDFSPVKERCLDFIDTLWTNEGGFHGHWGDDHLDCEYTYYGLLALGHLSL